MSFYVNKTEQQQNELNLLKYPINCFTKKAGNQTNHCYIQMIIYTV